MNVGCIADPHVACDMRSLITQLARVRTTVGVSAFLLLALHMRVRVYIWYGTRREDILALYAPWASSHIDRATPYEAIGCRIAVDEPTGKRSLRVVQDAQNITHWVACIKGDKCHGDGECAIDEETMTFHAVYLSLGRMVMETIADGDCGLDVMCLMIGWPREMASRRSLRCELCAFALEHVGNRALVAAMHALAELRGHLGLFELEASATELLQSDPCRHGDGGGGTLATEPARSFTMEEANAVAWKCRLPMPAYE